MISNTSFNQIRKITICMYFFSHIFSKGKKLVIVQFFEFHRIFNGKFHHLNF